MHYSLSQFHCMPFMLLLIVHLSYARFHLIKPSSNGSWLQGAKGEKVASGDLALGDLSTQTTICMTTQSCRRSYMADFIHFQDQYLFILNTNAIDCYGDSLFQFRWVLWHTRIVPKRNIFPSQAKGFYSVPASALPSHMSSLLALLVHTEQRKSSNKMPNRRYLIAGTLTFSSSYLMVVFICQTNVKNTIPRAQSLWHRGQLFFSPPACLCSLPPSPPTGLWTAELEARHLQYHSCHSIGDIEENSHSPAES